MMSCTMNGFNDSRVKNDPEEAKKYTERRTSKHTAEMALLKRACTGLPGVETFLDSPCGYGRAAALLDKIGYTVTAVDLGQGILDIARSYLKNTGCTVKKADLRELPFEDGKFDAILCFRFIHHLGSDEARQTVINELCRTSSKYVLISYLSPCSVTNIKRSIRVALGGHKSTQNSIAKKKMDSFFAVNQFTPAKNYAQMNFFKSLHLAIYKKNGLMI